MRVYGLHAGGAGHPQAAALAVIELARQGRYAQITALFAPQFGPWFPRRHCGRPGSPRSPREARWPKSARRYPSRLARHRPGENPPDLRRRRPGSGGRRGHRRRAALDHRRADPAARGRGAGRRLGAAGLRGPGDVHRARRHPGRGAVRGTRHAEPAPRRPAGPGRGAALRLRPPGPGRDHRPEQAVQGPRLGPGHRWHRGAPLREGHPRAPGRRRRRRGLHADR